MTKTPKTFETVEAARQKYAVLTPEEFKPIPVGDLRKIASEIGINNITRHDGTYVKSSSAKKSELIEAIYQACEDKRKIAASVEALRVLPPEQAEAVRNIVNVANDETESFIGTKVGEIWEALRLYMLSRWDAETQTWLATNGELLSLVGDLAMNLRNSSDSIYTVLNRKAFVLKNMRLMLQAESESPYYREMTDLFNQFERMVNGSLKTLQNQKTADQSTKVYNRKSSVSEVRIEPLLNWAIDLLGSLTPDDPATLWSDVAIALMLVTGRRQSEVMSSARFELTGSDNTVMFYGQLKTKTREDAPESYEIPVLAPPGLVVAALNWLEAKGKRESDPKKAHNRFSRYISDQCKKRSVLMEVVFTPEGAKSPVFKAHLLRQIYAQKCIQTTPRGIKSDVYISRILGHKEGDISTADSYDADIVLVD